MPMPSKPISTGPETIKTKVGVILESQPECRFRSCAG
jgi:hypothetical protein